MFVGSMKWAEVDPRRRAFRLDGVEAAVRRALEAALSRRRWQQEAEEAIDRTLRHDVGPWTGGWRWGVEHGGMRGGVVQAWCCGEHSVDEPGPTAKRAVAALREWREHLERVAALFERILAPSYGDAAARSLEDAARQVVAFSMEETRCRSAWFVHAVTVLTWFLEDRGAVPREAARAAQAALDGRFEEDLEPDADAIRDVAEEYGRLAAATLRR